MTAIKKLKNKAKDIKNQSLDFFTPFNEMRNKMNHMFNKFFTDYDDSWVEGRDGENFFTPRSDIIETKNEYKIIVDMPGVNEKNIDVSIDNGSLKITGRKEGLHETKDVTIHIIERNYGSFTKTIRLPDNVSQDEVKAHFKNGVLELLIPKTGEEAQEAKKIKVVSS
jgi:HSP20 family protein